MHPTPTPPRTRLLVWAALGLLVYCFVLNRAFVDGAERTAGTQVNDVATIYAGYRATPHLLRDGLRWWHGPWIQEGICSYRPLSAYLYWVDCWLGERCGQDVWGWVGLLLLWVDSLLAAALAWRLTRWRGSAVLAALLLGAVQRFVPGAPDYWLWWFPVHQEIATGLWVLATLLCWDLWLETGSRARLALLLLSFAAGCFTKESLYILPAVLAVHLYWRTPRRETPREAWTLVAVLCLAVVGLWLLRAHWLVHPRNPQLRFRVAAHMLGYNLLNVYTRFVLVGEWGSALAPLTCLLAAGLARRRGWGWARVVPLVGLVYVLTFNVCGQSAIPPLFALLKFNGSYQTDLLRQLGLVGSLVVLWRARAELPSLAVLATVVSFYLPNMAYVGWHYDLVPFHARVLQWALVLPAVVHCWRESR